MLHSVTRPSRAALMDGNMGMKYFTLLIAVLFFLLGFSISDSIDIKTKPVFTPVANAPLTDPQGSAALMGKVKELGHKALLLGYTCHATGMALDECSAHFDDVFDKAIAGDPI